MGVIYNRNFADGNQRFLSLNNSDYLRPIGIGTAWSRIRIGIHYCVGTVSENAWPIRGGLFSLGICRNIQNSPAVLTPSHAFGVGIGGVPNSTSVINWTYNAGTAGNSYMSLGNFYFYRVVAGTFTTSNTGSFTTYAPTNTTLGGALARRGILIVDINKSALVTGNITQGLAGNAVAHCALDLSTSDLYSALEWYASGPPIQGTNMTNLALGNTLAFDESVNGGLDTVFLYWSHYTVPLELYQIAVYRVG